MRTQVDHVHDVYAFFCSRYVAILSPKFDTEQMISKGPSSLPKMKKRILMWMAHKRAHDKLLHLMKLTGGIFIPVYENYDTMTCSECFNRHHPGIRKIYSCCNPKCKFKGYRDESGWTTYKKFMIRVLIANDKFDKKLAVDDDDDDEMVVDASQGAKNDTKSKVRKPVVKKPVVKSKVDCWDSEFESEEDLEESDLEVVVVRKRIKYQDVQDAKQEDSEMAQGPDSSIDTFSDGLV